mmetsp:Transcript_5223/g.9204  ORF Transcript_5223/g.9204 Transcript_5223/m.9204 type:complete len:148 (-) Transcript_5223:4589-5032(-)
MLEQHAKEQHITMHTTGTTGFELPNIPIARAENTKLAAIVTPDTGLFELPTSPAIYADTAEKRNDNTTTTIVITTECPQCPPTTEKITYSATTTSQNTIATIENGMSLSRLFTVTGVPAPAFDMLSLICLIPKLTLLMSGPRRANTV